MSKQHKKEDIENYKPDVARSLQVKRGEIYLINLDENNPVNDKDIPSLSTTGLIAKKRPCLVISTAEYNTRGSISFRIAPIKSNNTTKSTEDYIRDSYDILIPINMIDGTKFIVVNQTRVITVKQVVSYLCTLENPAILEQVDKEIVKMDTNIDIDHMVDQNVIINRFGDMQAFYDYCEENKNEIQSFRKKQNYHVTKSKNKNRNRTRNRISQKN